MAGVTVGGGRGAHYADVQVADVGAGGVCSCPSCLTGGICLTRYGVVVSYERAVQAPDQRLQLSAQIVAHLAATLDMSRTVVAAVYPTGAIGTVVAWRPLPNAELLYGAYVGTYAATDPFAPGRFLASTLRVVTVADVGGTERVHRAPYGLFLAAAGLEALGAMYLRHHGRIVASIVLLRDVGAPQLTTDEIAAARRLHPLLEAAYACSLHTLPASAANDLFDQAQLTRREREVVRVAVAGARNAEIAGALHVSVATVKIHLHHAFAKLGVRSRMELAARLQSIHPGSD